MFVSCNTQQGKDTDGVQIVSCDKLIGVYDDLIYYVHDNKLYRYGNDSFEYLYDTQGYTTKIYNDMIYLSDQINLYTYDLKENMSQIVHSSTLALLDFEIRGNILTILEFSKEFDGTAFIMIDLDTLNHSALPGRIGWYGLWGKHSFYLANQDIVLMVTSAGVSSWYTSKDGFNAPLNLTNQRRGE